MVPYAAPVRDMLFVLDHLVRMDRLTTLPGYEDATPDIVAAVLEEAGKLAADVIAPLNDSGDREHAVFDDGVVRTPKGFREAYAQYCESGWNAVPFDPDYGGQGLPWAVAFAVQEMWQASNMSFGLCPLLNQGAVEAIAFHADEPLKRIYLPKMISGEWTGTMNLTEPQAGSDLAAVHCKAERDGDRYRLFGQKVFITYGDHDLAENIVHLVLARLPDAPEGVKGISLFLVPKMVPGSDGAPGQRNDLRCVSLEHKLGINASPTAVMAFGDNDGAVGWLVGKENHGLACMFTMMNNARLSVGLQGVAIADRAYQQARDYARERGQGHTLAGDGDTVPIVDHPDVRRMLMTMKARTEAGRALSYVAAADLDIAHRHPDAAARAAAQARVDLLTPIVKAWCSDGGVETASLGIQVHGGVGYIEETGASQHLRDARVAPIYEGTNGIQAADLVFRKLLRDDGAAVRAYIAEIRGLVGDEPAPDPEGNVSAIQSRLAEAVDVLDNATGRLLADGASDTTAAAAAASPYLEMFGIVAGGDVMARSALAASRGLADAPDDRFLHAKLMTARFYADNILPQAGGLLVPVAEGRHSVMAVDEDLL